VPSSASKNEGFSPGANVERRPYRTATVSEALTVLPLLSPAVSV